MAPIIQVKNLIKTYKKAKENAVDDISFQVQQGELFAFLGPNGAGKTTTISILTTTLSKTSGTVHVAGYDLDTQQNQVRNKIGVIFQNPSIDNQLSAEENIRFHTILYGIHPFRPSFALMPQEYKNRVQELAEILDIKKDIFKPIKHFSGGMKRKLEIIRGLMHKPNVLFLDEPTVGLDPVSRASLWSYLTKIRKETNTTIFLTTHYLDEVEDADTICIINNGKIIAKGSPDKIKEALVSNYIIVDSKKRDTLEKELQQKKIAYHKTRQHNFKIDATQDKVQQIIHQIKTPLHMLKVHTPSLEQAYLEIINTKK